MNKKVVFYIGNFGTGTAAALKRVVNNSLAIQELGYKVHLVGCEKDTNDIPTDIEGLAYTYLKWPESISSWLCYKKQFKYLQNILQESGEIANIDTIICYGAPGLSLILNLIRKFCRSHHIRFAIDVVDWLAVPDGNILYKLIKGFDTIYQKQYINNKADAMICISQYLKQYYSKAVKRVVVIPPLTRPEECQPGVNDIKTIVYAGFPFPLRAAITPIKMKDRLDRSIKLLCECLIRGARFEFHILGISKEEYLRSVPAHEVLLERWNSNIMFHGRVLNNVIREAISQADYTILLRDCKKDTMAGFPTKVAESISLGTPVITNDTSDIKKYLASTSFAFFLDNKDEEENIKSILECLSKTSKEMLEMKQKCIHSGIFEYNRFVDNFKEFFKDSENSYNV